MIRRANQMLRRFQAQRGHIFFKRLNVFRRVIKNADALFRRILNNPVVHVGQIHHMVHVKAARAQKSTQNILKHERPVISDVRVVVYGRPACVHPDFARMQRRENFFAVAQRVFEQDFAHPGALLRLLHSA